MRSWRNGVTGILLGVVSTLPVMTAVCALLCAPEGHAPGAVRRAAPHASASCHDTAGADSDRLAAVTTHGCSGHDLVPADDPASIAARRIDIAGSSLAVASVVPTGWFAPALTRINAGDRTPSLALSPPSRHDVLRI